MSEWKKKRFWKTVAVEETPDGFEIRLDDRAVKTPSKAALYMPTRKLADAVAEEWEAQVENIKPETMPLTRAANSAIDKIMPQHVEVADLIADYGGTDLLCYRAASPAELVARQAEAWDPLLQWCEDELGVTLNTTAGVVYVAQPKTSIRTLNTLVHAMNPFQLAGFHDLVSISGSLIIGLAVTKKFLPVDELWFRARIDESWQEEQWGKDEEASETAELKRLSFQNAAKFHFLSSDRNYL